MSDALAPDTRLGPYKIDAFISAGGMGQVDRARDPRLGRQVPIKLRRAKAGFLARLASNCNSPRQVSARRARLVREFTRSV